MIISSSSSIINNLFINNGMAIEIIVSSNSTIENNTIVDSGTGIACQACSPGIERNIINQSIYGIACLLSSSPTILCNNIYNVTHRYGGCSDQTGINGNISIDPEFCGIEGSGNYFLQSDSPCAPGNHPDLVNCGLIGAFEVKCGTVPAKKFTWGALKALFEGARRDSTTANKEQH